MTGLVIVMISNKALTIENALFITLGANIGSCVTTLIGIIGSNLNSKRVAVIHFTFNFLGCALFTPILWIFGDEIISLLKHMVAKEGMQIAIFHLFFNCITAIITAPLIKYLVRFSEFVIKEKDKEQNLEKLIDNAYNINDVLRNDTILNVSDSNTEDNSDGNNEENEEIEIIENKVGNNIEVHDKK